MSPAAGTKPGASRVAGAKESDKLAGADCTEGADKMKVLAESRELSKAEIYHLAKSADIRKMSDAIGSTLEVDAFVLYEDENTNGEMQEVVSIRTVDGETYATNSKSACDCMHDILDVFDPVDVKKVKVLAGTSKNNRKFLMLAWEE